MEKWLLLSLILFFFHFPSFSSSSSSSSSFNSLCHHDESFALLQFKSSFTTWKNGTDSSCDGSPMKTATWKNRTDCCSWHGVTCDTVSGHVIGLNLGCEGFQGILHPNSTLFHLAHLQMLNLSNNYLYNNFSGSLFHSMFGRFMSLTHLDLSYCFFQDEIPSQISHLSKLQSLHLSGNGNLVWKETTLKRLLQNATSLRELFLDYTDMSLIRPNSLNLLFNQSFSLVTLSLRYTRLSGKLKKNFICLPSIQELDMSDNHHLEGQLPELSCSASLNILDFSGCGFQGSIPMSFSNFTRLTSLILSFNNLNGSIPSSMSTFSCLIFLYLNDNVFNGQIPNSFHQSNKFQIIDLSGNKIGGEIPTSFSNLQHLVNLDLSYNSLSGQIPDVFGRMAKLQELRLYSNNLVGQIPLSLFNLTQLVRLDCSYNKLRGPLPNKMSGFQQLIRFRLNDNRLNGTIPSSLLSLPRLLNLYLSNNQLTGHISSISSYSLQALYLGGNELQGNIPESIFHLVNLAVLDLSSNNLSGVVNFQNFSKLQNLNYLSLSQNAQLSLTFESNVSYNFSQLRELYLSSVNLTEFPKSLENFPSLDYFDVSNNKLNGRVPNWLFETAESLNLSQNCFTSIDQISRNVDQLNSLDLSFNLLEGDISLSICSMKSLYLLNLAHNKLTGIIPQYLANLSSLQVLDLQMNRFYGTLPSNFSKYSDLRSLNLNGNQIEGHLPKSLSRCKRLEFLNLGSNKIEDKFPDWIQTLQDLKVLVLRDNKLHGHIANLKIKNQFPSLVIFDISGNNFSGPLPPEAYFKNYEAMKVVTQVRENTSLLYVQDSAGSYDSVTVANKGINMTLVKIPINFVTIDLSRNKFNGGIPNDIGELHALKGLNLSHNRLTGPIPQSMRNLTNLESLDLSSNILTGMIPEELTNLNSLEVLDLSNNHLVGEIPQGKQFNTFTNDSYKGNLGLCGLPLSKKCGPEQDSPPSVNNFWSEDKSGFGWKPVAIGYGCGFVFGIGLGYWMFLIGKPRWLVMIFGGHPKRRVNRRTRVRRNNGPTMNQMVQMS